MLYVSLTSSSKMLSTISIIKINHGARPSHPIIYTVYIYYYYGLFKNERLLMMMMMMI